jgi:hypothetical protein
MLFKDKHKRDPPVVGQAACACGGKRKKDPYESRPTINYQEIIFFKNEINWR